MRRGPRKAAADHDPAERTPAAAYLKAVQRLSYRDQSEHELRSALLRYGFPPEIAEATLTRLRGERALDDPGFATRFARSRLRYRGLGRNRIRQDLRVRGIRGAVAEAGIAEALTDVPEADAIDALARRYWKAHTRDEPGRRVQKLWAFLVRRGFPGSVVQQRLRGLWPRWSDALDGLDPIDEDATAAGAGADEEE